MKVTICKKTLGVVAIINGQKHLKIQPLSKETILDELRANHKDLIDATRSSTLCARGYRVRERTNLVSTHFLIFPPSLYFFTKDEINPLKTSSDRIKRFFLSW